MKKFVSCWIVYMLHMILEATEMPHLVLVFGADAPSRLPMWKPYYHGSNAYEEIKGIQNSTRNRTNIG